MSWLEGPGHVTEEALWINIERNWELNARSAIFGSWSRWTRTSWEPFRICR